MIFHASEMVLIQTGIPIFFIYMRIYIIIYIYNRIIQTITQTLRFSNWFRVVCFENRMRVLSLSLMVISMIVHIHVYIT